MNLNIKSKLSGQIDWLRVVDKHGNIKHELKNLPNILLNSALSTSGAFLNSASVGAFAMSATAESYEDLDGTWNQTGNIITRATGTGTFPSSPSQIGQELRWGTGERCHVTARASDISITVSGPTRTITGGTIRRYDVNGSGPASSSTGSNQTSSASTLLSEAWDDVSGTYVVSRRFNFGSSATSYTLGSIVLSVYARIKLPTPITIDIDDQLQFVYTATETVIGRSQTYELGSESVGLPQKYSILSIVGDSTNVDVTFSAATHFLAGDKLDLRTVVPKRFAISSATSNSTTFTINTTLAHGLSISDSVTIEGASLAGYNGTFTVASVVDTDTITITDAANPGAMGVSGTIRLATPASYFEDLGLATIASMVSSSVARITSSITGVPADLVEIGGDPGVEVRVRRPVATTPWALGDRTATLQIEANAEPLADTTTFGTTAAGTAATTGTSQTITASLISNDWTYSLLTTWNAGAGTGKTRVKQFLQKHQYSTGGVDTQITLNTPFNKSDAQRLRLGVSKQLLRDLDLTGL